MKINYKILGIFLFGILFMGTSAALITSSYGLNDLSEDLEHQDFSDGYLNQDEDEDEEENRSEDDSPEDEDEDEDNSDDNPDDGEEEDTEDESSDDENDEVEEDDDDDGIKDEVEEENERELKFEEGEENVLKIESTLRNGSEIDSIEFVLNYDEGIKIEVSYENEYEDNSTEVERELEFEIEFKEIIEFVDIDGDDIYNSNIDDEIQEYEILNAEIIDQSIEKINNNTNMYYYEIGTSDGVFTIGVYFVEEFTKIGDNLVAPSQSKIDIKITNFPFEEDNSLLALSVDLESEMEYEEEETTDDEKQEYSENEKGVKFSNNNFTGYFTWSEFALMDGTNTPVYSSSAEIDEREAGEDEIYLNYPHGTEIIHDPKIGVQNALKGKPSTSTNMGIPGLPLEWFFIISVISILSVSYLVFRKTNR